MKKRKKKCTYKNIAFKARASQICSPLIKFSVGIGDTESKILRSKNEMQNKEKMQKVLKKNTQINATVRVLK